MSQAHLKKDIFSTFDHPGFFKAKSRILSHLILWVSGACRLSPEERSTYHDALLMQNFRQEPLEGIVKGLAEDLREQYHHRLSAESLFKQATLFVEEEMKAHRQDQGKII